MKTDNETSASIAIDTRIARGLDYYTGIVFETILTDLPSIGSVCSGGRYDNLAGMYTKQHLPGIGGSLGLDRLLAAMEQLGTLASGSQSETIFIAYFDADQLASYLELSGILRKAGFHVELYPEPKKLGQQLKYADTRAFPIAVIAGSDELARGACQVKDLRHKTTTEVAWKADSNKLVEAIHAFLRQPPGIQLA